MFRVKLLSIMSETGATYRKLTDLEWAEAVILWESGSVTLDDLVEKFGISRTALHEGFKKRGAVKGARAKEYAKRTEDALKSESALRAEEVKKFRDKFHGFGDFLMNVTMMEIRNMVAESPRTPETQRKIMAHLKAATDIYSKIRDQKFHLYDLYREVEEGEDIPEIAVAQYSPEQLEKIRKDQEREDDIDDDALLADAAAALDDLLSGSDGTP